MHRLSLLCEYPTLLGGERSMLATIPTVTAAGFDVHVAAPPDGPLAEALGKLGVCHVAWQTHDEHGERLPLANLRSELLALVQHQRPHLVHANSLSVGRIAGPVSAQCRVRSLGHLRDIVKLSRQVIDDLNVNRRLVAVSRATRDFHITQGLDASKCCVAHNGVDLDEFRPRPPSGYLHRDLRLAPTARLIAVVGQLGLRKATDVALMAALQIASDAPDAHWLIVGERTSNKCESLEFEALLQSLTAEPPLAGQVHFLGSRDDVPQILSECTLLVHAARQEPLGRILLEAAATGLAVVATDVGGTREIFPAEANAAVLVSPDNRFALADAILALLRDNERRRSLGIAARRRAEQAFDSRQAAARLIELYQDVLS